MVNPPAHTPFNGIFYPVIPERIFPGRRLMEPENINKAPSLKPRERPVLLRMESHLPQKVFRVVDVFFFRRDIEIPKPEQRLIRAKISVKVFIQPFKPLKFVPELLGQWMETLRDVCVDDGYF